MYLFRNFCLKNPCQKKMKKEKRGSRKTWKYIMYDLIIIRGIEPLMPVLNHLRMPRVLSPLRSLRRSRLSTFGLRKWC